MLIHQHTLLFESNAEKETSRIGIIDPACKVRRETSSDLPRPMSCWTKKETRQNLSHSTRQIPSSPELVSGLFVCRGKARSQETKSRDQTVYPKSLFPQVLVVFSAVSCWYEGGIWVLRRYCTSVHSITQLCILILAITFGVIFSEHCLLQDHRLKNNISSILLAYDLTILI